MQPNRSIGPETDLVLEWLLFYQMGWVQMNAFQIPETALMSRISRSSARPSTISSVTHFYRIYGDAEGRDSFFDE